MKNLMFIMTTILLILSACGGNEVENVEETNKEEINEAEAREKEETEAREKEEAEAREKEEAEAREKEEAEAREKEEAKKAEEINNTVADFDNLPLAIKVHLATSIVDERAYAHDLSGFTLTYNLEGDELFVQVHSGVGSGHPIYKIQIDSEGITPIGGIVNVSAIDIEETSVDSTTVKKEELYNIYSEYKDTYNSGESNVGQDDSLPERYESMKNEIQ